MVLEIDNDAKETFDLVFDGHDLNKDGVLNLAEFKDFRDYLM